MPLIDCPECGKQISDKSVGCLGFFTRPRTSHLPAGGDYKQMRGFDAQPTYSAHFVADPRLADAIERFLAAERTHAAESLDWLPDHSALKT